ncbi:MAG: hypothetical protein HRU37_07370 [Roseibacillus sp.]|nr:hypothetical protein [Roseibacillus sp.]
MFHLFGLDIKDVNYARPNGVTNLTARQRPAEEPGVIQRCLLPGLDRKRGRTGAVGVENGNPEGRPDV